MPLIIWILALIVVISFLHIANKMDYASEEGQFWLYAVAFIMFIACLIWASFAIWIASPIMITKLAK